MQNHLISIRSLLTLLQYVYVQNESAAHILQAWLRDRVADLGASAGVCRPEQCGFRIEINVEQ